MEAYLLKLSKDIKNNYFENLFNKCFLDNKYNINDLFRCFSKIYLKKIYNLDKINYVNELSNEDLKLIGITPNDIGIDLIGKDYNNVYYLICAKYRKRSNNKITISHREINDYKRSISKLENCKNIIISNADSVKHINDLSIEYFLYDNLKEIDKNDIIYSLENLREMRIKYYINNS